MKTKKNRRIMTKAVSIVMALTLMLLAVPISTYAAELEPKAILNANNTITFSNLDCISVNESVEFETVDVKGNPVTVGIECVPSKTRAGGTEWKVWYTGITINAHFYMTVVNNKVTNVYDDWILIVGGTYDDSSLTKTRTSGKLSFKVEAYAGIMAATCWLKGTVTGNNNDITISYQM